MSELADEVGLVGGVAPVAAGGGKTPVIAIELFSGAGGMSLGFEAAGFDVLVAVDNNPIHVATHEWNFPQTHSLCSDINVLSAEDILTAAKNRWAEHYPNIIWPGEIDCVFGGPSCQGFSEIGRRDPSDERNGLLGEFAQIVVDIRPRYFVMENVPGLLAPVNEIVLKETLKIFASAGYRLVSGGPVKLNAGNFGVPQGRRRVFVVGARSDVAMPSEPSGSPAVVTAAEALNDLLFLEEYKDLGSAEAVKMTVTDVCELEELASPYVKSLRKGKDKQHGSYLKGYDRPWDRTTMTCAQRTVHRPDVIERFRNTPEGAEELISRLQRLRSSGLAPTLRAGTGRDHGSFTSARPIHYSLPRVITVREAARLHSFPDWFRFHVTKWHGFQQVGNSVPPFLARAVAKSIIDAMQVIPQKSIARTVDRDAKLLSLNLVEAAKYYGIDPGTLPKESRIRVKKQPAGNA